MREGERRACDQVAPSSSRQADGRCLADDDQLRGIINGSVDVKARRGRGRGRRKKGTGVLSAK